jgi:hypothetical protein
MRNGPCALAIVAAPALLASSCGPEFEPGYLIRDARVLAIRADPPEAVPGQSVVLTPLVVGPGGNLEEGAGYEASWWRCPDEEASPLEDEERCSQPAARIDLGGGAPKTHGVPVDLFALPAPGSDEAPDARLLGAALGFWRVIGLTARASDRVVEAFKRVVVFATPLPLGSLDPRLANLDVRVDNDGVVVANTNPLLLGVEVRAGEPNGPVVSALKPGSTYWLRPRYDERELQEYYSLEIDLAGLDLEDPTTLRELSDEELLARFTRVRRCEVPVFTWYVTAGRLRRDTTVDERVVKGLYLEERGVRCPDAEGDEGEPRRPEVRFLAPAQDAAPADGIVRAWVVMRDGRGGTAFTSFEMPLE